MDMILMLGSAWLQTDNSSGNAQLRIAPGSKSTLHRHKPSLFLDLSQHMPPACFKLRRQCDRRGPVVETSALAVAVATALASYLSFQGTIYCTSAGV